MVRIVKTREAPPLDKSARRARMDALLSSFDAPKVDWMEVAASLRDLHVSDQLVLAGVLQRFRFVDKIKQERIHELGRAVAALATRRLSEKFFKDEDIDVDGIGAFRVDHG